MFKWETNAGNECAKQTSTSAPQHNAGKEMRPKRRRLETYLLSMLLCVNTNEEER